MSAVKTPRVEGFAGLRGVKDPCVAVSTSEITLSGEQNIDGAGAFDGDRVLVAGQSVPETNGIYIVSTGAWSRAKDFNSGTDILSGTIVVVAKQGSTGQFYQLSTPDKPITVGASQLTFTVLSDFALAAALASGANGDGASLIAIEDAAANFVATEVEAALAELHALITTATQTFTGSQTGYASPLTPTVSYKISGTIVELSINAGSVGVSDDNTLALSGLPAAIRPATALTRLIRVQDNNTNQLGVASISTGGVITFGLGAAGSVFTASGNKGLPGGWSMMYGLI